MVKADLGIKRACPSCATRFYDLQKRPIECPKCHFTFEPESLYKQRRPRASDVVVPVPSNLDQEEEQEDEEAETEEAEEEEAVIDEAPLLVPSDDDDEEVEVAAEEESEDAGMTVVDADVADIEDIDEEAEAGTDEGLLEEVEDEEDDVTGIIDPGVRKGET